MTIGDSDPSLVRVLGPISGLTTTAFVGVCVLADRAQGDPR